MGGGVGGGGGGWLEEFGNNANLVQLQLPTGTELGNTTLQCSMLKSSLGAPVSNENWSQKLF